MSDALITRLAGAPLYVGGRHQSVHAHHPGFGESGIGGEDGNWRLYRSPRIKTAYHHYGDR